MVRNGLYFLMIQIITLFNSAKRLLHEHDDLAEIDSCEYENYIQSKIKDTQYAGQEKKKA